MESLVVSERADLQGLPLYSLLIDSLFKICALPLFEEILQLQKFYKKGQ